MTEPSFVLSGPTGTLVTHGLRRGYTDVCAAQAALRANDAPIVVGALPFDLSAAAALQVPDAVRRTSSAPDWAEQPMPTTIAMRPEPEPQVHEARVAAAVQQLRAPGTALHKVVLARALRLTAEQPWDARTVLRRLLRADPGAYGYLADLSAAGPRLTGAALVGASPELLVERTGELVSCRPFAGSAPRSSDPVVDRANAAALADSAKNRHEHQLVIDVMRAALEPLCVEVRIAAEPVLHHTDALWHLGTPITARLREKSTTALDLALALHPTPAVGGVPTDAAQQVIADLEGDRGFYAGAVGWCDADGDGSWIVAIRCAQLSADRHSALARSGGGIVAESDPREEVEETTAKFRTILAGLGVTT